VAPSTAVILPSCLRLNCINFLRPQVVSLFLLQDTTGDVLIKPNAVLLEALRVAAPQSFEIGTFFELFAKAFRPEPDQAEQAKAVPFGVVRYMRQLGGDDGSPAVLGGSAEGNRRIHPYHVLHPPYGEKPPGAETRLKVIGGAVELSHADVPVAEFGE